MIDIGVNEFILALGLNHVVTLLAQSSDDPENGKFRDR